MRLNSEEGDQSLIEHDSGVVIAGTKITRESSARVRIENTEKQRYARRVSNCVSFGGLPNDGFFGGTPSNRKARLIRETARLSPDFERAGGVVQRLCGAGA